MDKQLIEKYSVIIAEFMELKINYAENGGLFGKDVPYWSGINLTAGKNGIKVGCEYEMNYHTDWNEIHKVWYKLWSSELDTIEKIEYFAKKRKFIEKALILLPEPYEVFVLIGETIEYLQTKL